MTSVGMTFVELSDDVRRSSLSRQVMKAAELTPEGRTLAVIYHLPAAWKVSLPVEEIVISCLLGAPQTRTDSDDWGFFANLSVRICRPSSLERVVIRELGVVLMKRCGEKPYIRRHSATDELLARASLPTLHPVFTRDVANNVWHLPFNRYQARLRGRLGSLLAWPDEDLLLVGESGVRRVQNSIANLDGDLVGVPTKITYSFG